MQKEENHRYRFSLVHSSRTPCVHIANVTLVFWNMFQEI